MEKEEMIFIDSSAYLSILLPFDSNRKTGLELANVVFSSQERLITSYAILGEVLTIGSIRHNRQAAIDFVEDIFGSKTEIVLENMILMDRSFQIFQKIRDKDVGWVDCYSFVIIEAYKIEKVFSFDRDFKRYSKAKILGE